MKFAKKDVTQMLKEYIGSKEFKMLRAEKVEALYITNGTAQKLLRIDVTLEEILEICRSQSHVVSLDADKKETAAIEAAQEMLAGEVVDLSDAELSDNYHSIHVSDYEHLSFDDVTRKMKEEI